jgi:ABC-type dipeptide/oligopeptide/nickel transport system permease subunit
VLTWRRFLKHRAAVASLGALIVIVIAMFGSAIWIPPEAARTGVDLDNINAPPSLVHPMGTDQAGADVLVRIVLGGRVSLTVGFQRWRWRLPWTLVSLLRARRLG